MISPVTGGISSEIMSMKTRYFLLAAVVIILCGGGSVHGQTSTNNVSTNAVPEAIPTAAATETETIRNRLLEIEKNLTDSGDEQAAEARQNIKDIRQTLDNAEALNKQFTDFGREIANFTEEKQKLEEEIKKYGDKSQISDPGVTLEDGVDAIKSLHTASQSQLNVLKNELKQLEEKVAREVSRPSAIQKEIQDLATSEEQNQKARKDQESAGENQASPIRSLALQARSIANSASDQKLNEELNTHAQRYELLSLRRQLKSLEVQRSENLIGRLDEMLTVARQAQAEKIADDSQNVSGDVSKIPPGIQNEIARNNKYSKDNLDLVADLTNRQREIRNIEADIKKTQNDFDDLKEELEIGNADETLRQLLVEMRQDISSRILPGFRLDTTEALLKDARLQRLRYDQALRQVAPGTMAFDENLDKILVDSENPEKDRELLEEVFTKRKEILEVLESNQRNLVQSLDTLQNHNRDYYKLLEDFSAYLNRHLMWVPTSDPVWKWRSSLEQLPGVTRFFSAELNEILEWLRIRENLLEAIVWILASLAISIYTGLKARHWRIKFEEIASKVRRISTDKFLYTLRILAFSALFPLRYTAVLWVGLLGMWMDSGSRMLGEGLFIGVLLVAVFWHWHSFIHWLMVEFGAGPVHFRWKSELLNRASKELRWFVPAICIPAFAVTFLEFSGPLILNQLAVQPMMIFGCLSYVIFFMRIFGKKGIYLREFLDSTGIGWLQRFCGFWRWLLILVPCGLMGFSAWGYHYAAVTLGLHFIISLLWIGVVIIAYFVGIRWFFVKERRVALEQALERRRIQQAQQKGDDSTNLTLPPIPDENSELDLSVIKDQTRGFLKSLFGILILFGMWWIWSSVFPALEFFDDIQLWSYEKVTETGNVREWFTLFDALLVGVVILLTTAAARNFPGVVEIMLLEQLPLQAGVRYAITSVLQYIVVASGIMLLFNLLGFSFKQLGWMLAALSLGLGFGLQEIVANFVCGILLLLERPIRVGDIVTVSGISGVVSKIRIRATTVTDWDRKEFIVPNKEFITGHILNWTLSNKLNRVVVNVGIAYGSNIEKAIQTLQGIVRNHPDILKEPEPMVTFESFGDSALNLTVRFFLPDLDRRLMIIHEVHSRIHDRFQEEGISIPFPQRDIHIFHENGPGPQPMT